MSQNSSDSEGLVSVRIADVVSINPGVDKSRFQDDDLVPFIPMPAVEAGTGRIDVTEMRPFSRVKSGFTSFCPGDVLFAKITPCMENGKAAVVPQLEQQIGFGSTEFFVLRPTEGINPKYLYYFVSSSAFRHEAQHHMTGVVGQKRVPKRFMENEKIPLASTPRQNRIVEKIETLFTQLDKGEEALRAVQRQLQVYRQSILKAAVTGELTRDWREVNKDRIEPANQLLERILQRRRESRFGRFRHDESIEPDTSDLPELPGRWVWATFSQLFDVFGGATPSRKEPAFWGGDIPWVSSGEVAFRRIRDTTEKITEQGYESCSTKLHPVGTVLLAMIGEGKTRGQAAILDLPACNNQNAAALRVSESGLPPEYVYYFLMSHYEESRKQGQGGNQPALNGKKVKGFRMPLPPLEEAHEIVRLIESTFSNSDAVETWCKEELARSNTLRNTILKNALAGRLVKQDPSDEPASEFLARIKAERIAASDRTRRKARA